jgi:hypothetical protein
VVKTNEKSENKINDLNLNSLCKDKNLKKELIFEIYNKTRK